jgi:hypothetical protein
MIVSFTQQVSDCLNVVFQNRQLFCDSDGNDSDGGGDEILTHD